MNQPTTTTLPATEVAEAAPRRAVTAKGRRLIEAALAWREARAAGRTPSPQVAAELLDSVEGLVRSVIRPYTRASRRWAEDYLQVGMVAALEALERWDPERGAPSGVVRQAVRTAIKDAVRVHEFDGLRRFDFEGRWLVAQGRDQELADVTRKRVASWRRPDSIDRPVGDSDGRSTTLGELIAGDEDVPVGDVDERSVVLSALRSVAARLDDPVAVWCFVRHYGLDGEEPSTLGELRAALGRTNPETVRTAIAEVRAALEYEIAARRRHGASLADLGWGRDAAERAAKAARESRFADASRQFALAVMKRRGRWRDLVTLLRSGVVAPQEVDAFVAWVCEGGDAPAPRLVCEACGTPNPPAQKEWGCIYCRQKMHWRHSPWGEAATWLNSPLAPTTTHDGDADDDGDDSDDTVAVLQLSLFA